MLIKKREKECEKKKSMRIYIKIVHHISCTNKTWKLINDLMWTVLGGSSTAPWDTVPWPCKGDQTSQHARICYMMYSPFCIHIPIQ